VRSTLWAVPANWTCPLFQTRYRPSPGDTKGEEAGEGLTEKLRKYAIYRKMLADYFDEPEEKAMNKAEQFEKEVKQRFIKEPGQMKLLIVVDKLLTTWTNSYPRGVRAARN
jgi:type I restriction enzyme R subunit